MTNLATDEDPRADLRWGTIPAMLADVASRRSDHLAVVDNRSRLTHAELYARSSDLASNLVEDGLNLGTRVAIWAPNSVEWAIAALATWLAGGIVVTINTRFKGAEAAHVIRSAGARRLVVVDQFLGTDYPSMLGGETVGPLDRIALIDGGEDAASDIELPGCAISRFVSDPAPVGKADHALSRRHEAVTPTSISDLLYTSGTTGSPKGVATTHAQTLRTYGTWASIVGLEASDRYLIVNPLFHTFGLKAGLLASLMLGATAYLERTFDASVVAAHIDRDQITVLPGPPTLYQSLLDLPDRARHQFSSLRLGVTGAAVVPVELVEAMRTELGFETVLTAYGLTESTGTVSMCRRGDSAVVIATTSGRPIPGVDVKIADPTGTSCRPGDPGEILVRGYTVMDGYWEDPEATGETIDVDGWLHTGDIGIADEAGNITITDRIKDMFIVGGFNAYPAEIETHLRQFPGVAAIAVVGVPDERLGEVACAFVVRHDEGNGVVAESDRDFSQRLVEFARQHIANYKVPRHIRVVPELPLNASGKVLKRVLRDQFNGTDHTHQPKRGAST